MVELLVKSGADVNYTFSRRKKQNVTLLHIIAGNEGDQSLVFDIFF